MYFKKGEKRWLEDHGQRIGLMITRAVLVIELQVGRSTGRRSQRSLLLLLHKLWPLWVVDCIVKLSIARR